MFINIIIFCVLLIFALVSFVFGYHFSKGQWLMFIAGYNDLPKEKRERLDKKVLSKESSKTAYVAGIYLLIQGAMLEFLLFDIVKGMFVSIILLGAPFLFFLIYMIKRAFQWSKMIK